MDQFAGGPQIQENLNDDPEISNTQLTNLEGDPLSLDGGGLYKPFKKAEVEDRENRTEPQAPDESIETDDGLEKFKENPNFPVLERFTEVSGIQISKKDMVTIGKAIGEKEITNTDLNITSIPIENKDVLVALDAYLWKVRTLNKDTKKTVVEGGEEVYVVPEEFKSSPILNNQENKMVQLLIENYSRFPTWEEGKADFNKDIQTAFDVSVNKIIENKKFPRNEAFSLAMKDIKVWDLETKMEALTYIHSLVNTSEWIQGKRDKALIGKRKAEHAKKKGEYLDFKIKKIETQMADEQQSQAEWKEERMQELQEQLQKLQGEKSQWDVFETGEIDKWWEMATTMKA